MFRLLVFVVLAMAALPSLCQPVSLKLLKAGRLAFVEGTINGQPVRLLIDLGSFQALGLSRSAMDRVAADRHAEADYWVDAQGNRFESRRFTAKDLSVGGLRVASLDGSEFLSASTERLRADGLIGFGLLKHYSLVFDYPREELRLYASSSTSLFDADCGGDRFEIRLSNGVVETVLPADSRRLIFQLDTGSTDNVLRPSSVDRSSADALHTIRRLVVGARDIGPLVFRLNEFRAPAVDGVLGHDFFDARKVCLDFSRSVGFVD
jgi:hypothetical protein